MNFPFKKRGTNPPNQACLDFLFEKIFFVELEIINRFVASMLLKKITIDILDYIPKFRIIGGKSKIHDRDCI